MGRPPATERETHRAQVRRAIMESAMALVAERGPSDVAMAHIAERAGIGRATLYGYFPDLDHILAAHLVERLRIARDDLESALDAEGDAVARLQRYVTWTIAAFAAEKAGGVAAGVTFEHFAPALHAEIDAAFGLLRALLARVLDDGRTAGAFRADLDVDLAADLLFHLVGGARRRVHGGEDLVSIERETIALVVGAVRAPDTGRRRR